MPDPAARGIDLARALDKLLEFVVGAAEEDAAPVRPINGHVLEEITQ
jgi:hypothetical protein